MLAILAGGSKLLTHVALNCKTIRKQQVSRAVFPKWLSVKWK